MNLGFFLVLYLLFMIPTYFIRLAVGVVFIAESGPETLAVNFSFFAWVLIGCLLALILVALSRGRRIGKPWLWAFPLIALVFDTILVLVPLVPTAMHILALVLGSIENSGRREPSVEA